MTDVYPQLTVSNIKHWYWEVEPHWSVCDIASNIGCSESTIYSFMKRHNIPRRSTSEANINRFNCPRKYKEFLKQRRSPDFRMSQSVVAKEVMYKPEIREKFLQAIKKSSEKRLSECQKLILFLLMTHKKLFITEIVRMVKRDLQSIDSTLRALYKRQYVTRDKMKNPYTFSNFKSHYQYSLTDKGRKLIKTNLENNDVQFKNFLENDIPSKKDPMTLQYEFIKRENIGKNQLTILKIIQNKGPKFLLDLLPILGLSKKTVDSSLRCLSSRAFLSKEKKVNPNYQGSINHRVQTYYSITDKCPILL